MLVYHLYALTLLHPTVFSRNLFQKSNRIPIFPYEVIEQELIYVVHITTVQRNIDINLTAVLSRISNAIFVNNYHNISSLSISKLREHDDAHHILLSRINWCVLGVENYKEVTTFLDEIKASYTVILYRGKEYNYFDYFISNVRNFLPQNVDLSTL